MGLYERLANPDRAKERPKRIITLKVYDAAMGLSRDARIGLLVGTIAAVFVPLLDPADPAWRIALLVILGGCLIWVVTELDWVRPGSIILSLTKEETSAPELNFYRLGIGILISVISVGTFGLVTWPRRPSAAEETSKISIPVPESSGAGGPSTSHGILRPQTPLLTIPTRTDSEERKPRPERNLESKYDLDLIPSYSDANLRAKGNQLVVELQGKWQEFDFQDQRIINKHVDYARNKTDLKEANRQRNQLRINLVALKPELDYARVVRDQMFARFGPSDETARNLKNVLGAFADLIGEVEGRETNRSNASASVALVSSCALSDVRHYI